MKKTVKILMVAAATIAVLGTAFAGGIVGAKIFAPTAINGLNGTDGVNGTNGKDGVDGKDGIDGSVITIGENGNWYIDGVDTGVSAKGEKGDTGAQGAQGEKGDKGETGAAGKDGVDGKDGIDGKDGADGADGTNGVDGKDGTNGTNGVDGTNGKDGTTTIIEVEVPAAVDNHINKISEEPKIGYIYRTVSIAHQYAEDWFIGFDESYQFNIDDTLVDTYGLNPYATVYGWEFCVIGIDNNYQSNQYTMYTIVVHHIYDLGTDSNGNYIIASTIK